MPDRRTIGILGGTFDPIHIGHIQIAEAAWMAFPMERLLFIPAARPPHKNEAGWAAPEDRLQMVRLAIANRPGFVASDMEIARIGPSYSVFTLEELRQQYGGDCRLLFIVGADAMADILSWYQRERVFQLAEFAVAERPGSSGARWEKVCEVLLPEERRRIHRFPAPLVDLSSSQIRQSIRTRSIQPEMLDPEVSAFIRRYHLYT